MNAQCDRGSDKSRIFQMHQCIGTFDINIFPNDYFPIACYFFEPSTHTK